MITFSHTAWGPGIPIPLLDTIFDGAISPIYGHVKIKPGVPAAHLIGVIEHIAKAVVDHITEVNINVLGPELPHPVPGVGPDPIVAAHMPLREAILMTGTD